MATADARDQRTELYRTRLEANYQASWRMAGTEDRFEVVPLPSTDSWNWAVVPTPTEGEKTHG